MAIANLYLRSNYCETFRTYPRTTFAVDFYVKVTTMQLPSLFWSKSRILGCDPTNRMLTFAPKLKVRAKGWLVPTQNLTRSGAWLVGKLRERRTAKDSQVAAQLNEKEYEEAGAGIECGCCFTDYPFVCFLSSLISLSRT